MIPIGLAMALDLQAAADEYLGWLQLEANRSPNTVRAYTGEIKRLTHQETAQHTGTYTFNRNS